MTSKNLNCNRTSFKLMHCTSVLDSGINVHHAFVKNIYSRLLSLPWPSNHSLVGNPAALCISTEVYLYIPIFKSAV